jgi:hypothetical protein
MVCLIGVMPGEQGIEQRFGNAETGLSQSLDRLREFHEAASRRRVEDAKRARHAKSLPLRRPHALAVIHEQQIGMQRLREL